MKWDFTILNSVVIKIPKIKRKNEKIICARIKTIKKKNSKVKFINIFLIISLPHLPLRLEILMEIPSILKEDT